MEEKKTENLDLIEKKRAMEQRNAELVKKSKVLDEKLKIM